MEIRRIKLYEDQGNGLNLPLEELPEFRKQNRKRQAKESTPEQKICGADTETIKGKCWIFSTEFGVYYLNNFEELINVMFDRDHGTKWKKSKASKNGVKRGIASKDFYFWNLKFDTQAVLKWCADDVIQKLIYGDLEGNKKVRINARTGEFTTDEYAVELEYLEGKHFKINPIKWRIGQYVLGAVEWWDISQFYYKIRLNSAAKSYLNKSKLEECYDGSILDASRFDDPEYREKYKIDIEKYALIDAQLCGDLVRLTRKDFLSQDIRFIKPYSMANVAQRALLDTCKIPTINHYFKEENIDLLKVAHSSYHGGWFETIGAGIQKDIQAFDLASAYPYIMYHLPDVSNGIWISGDQESEWYEYIERRKPLEIGFVEVYFEFPTDHKWHPLIVKSKVGTLVSPRIFKGWITAEEFEEALKWDPDYVIVGQWHYFESSNDYYPFRSFIEKFYKIKMEAAEDPVAYRVAKVAINSIYGKTVQAVDDVIGKLWNPFYSSTICGATRARLCELNRLNGKEAISFATDGVILPKEAPMIIPPRPLEAPYNLGEWENDGTGDVLILMSGVYSVLKDDKIKTTFRGSASYFLRPYRDRGLFDFFEVNKNKDLLITTVRKPYSVKQAAIKKDFSLINVFEEHTFTITPNGDSNKRMWPYKTPNKFGDLLNQWFPSYPQEKVQ